MKDYNSNKQKLNENFDKVIDTCKLRNTFTKFGISENEPITIFLKRDDKVLTKSIIEPTCGNNQPKTSERSSQTLNTEAFKAEIVNEFLKSPKELSDLGETILNMNETSSESPFSLEFFLSNRSSIAKACIIRSCGNCSNGQKCCWKEC